jgi:glycosyltransferase involved in cell wall biosynthesis
MQAVAGSERITVLLIEAVRRNAPHLELGEEAGLFVARSTYQASEHRVKWWRKAVNFLRYWRAFRKGFKAVVAQRGLPDLSHVHILVRPAILAWWIERRYGIPYLVSEQSSEYLDGTYRSKGWAFHVLNRRLFKDAAAVTVVSDWLGNGLKALGLCDGYVVVPNVIPGLDRVLPEPGPAHRFLVVADLVDRTKNVSGVIRALATTKATAPAVELSIIGDGPDRAMLEALAHSTGVADRVTFLGRLPNSAVLDHMARTGSVIVNSNVETFSVVTGEALAQGKPVIATRCGGPEAFIHQGNGILIGRNDIQALAAAMDDLSRDHQRYHPAAIRADVTANWGPTAVARGFAELYRTYSNPVHG